MSGAEAHIAAPVITVGPVLVTVDRPGIVAIQRAAPALYMHRLRLLRHLLSPSPHDVVPISSEERSKQCHR